MKEQTENFHYRHRHPKKPPHFPLSYVRFRLKYDCSWKGCEKKCFEKIKTATPRRESSFSASNKKKRIWKKFSGAQNWWTVIDNNYFLGKSSTLSLTQSGEKSKGEEGGFFVVAKSGKNLNRGSKIIEKCQTSMKLYHRGRWQPLGCKRQRRRCLKRCWRF